MSYNYESKYLDLSKNLYKFSNESKSDNKDQKGGQYSKTKKIVNQDDLNSETFLFFKEKDIIIQDVEKLTNIFINQVKNGVNNRKKYFRDLCYRVTQILIKYLESPSLLDNYIQQILDRLIDAIRCFLKIYQQFFMENEKFMEIPQQFDQIMNIMMTLINVRKEDNMRKYLGHSTEDFEPMIFFMISSHGNVSWETNYIMLTWLSVILLIPFDFKRLDTDLIPNYYLKKFQSQFTSLDLLILDFLKKMMDGNLKIGIMTSKCVEMLFRRPDMKKFEIFDQYIQWALKEIKEQQIEDSFMNYLSNVIQSLIGLIKSCEREYLVDIHQEFFESLVKIDYEFKEFNNTWVLRYLKLELFQTMIDKLLLKSSGRYVYRMVKRNLDSELDPNDQVPMITNTESYKPINTVNQEIQQEKINSDIHNMQYINLVEKTIDYILVALQDKNSQIRYLAAKGLAQISSKLPENLSDELIQEILSYYENSDQYMNHGICLVIGEFCRKGILTPNYLPFVTKILKKSLLFEDIEGLSSSGSIVRDSACFISWSLARFYTKETMMPFTNELSLSLILTSLFDKESNCRKAAAASFQENVGRQGTFKNGIEIISEMDYFSVGSINNCYLHLSPFVASFTQYTTQILNYLSHDRLFYFNKDIRILASKSLGLIALINPEYVIKEIIPFLLSKSLNGNIFEQHGSYLGLSCILQAFSGRGRAILIDGQEKDNIFLKSLRMNEQVRVEVGVYMEEFLKEFNVKLDQNIIEKIPDELKQEIVEVVKSVQKNLKGSGAEIKRIAIYQLIKSITTSEFILPPEIIKDYLWFLEEGFRTTIDEIHDSAVNTMQEFCQFYLKSKNEEYLKFLDHFINKILKERIKDKKKAFCRSISCFPANLLILKKNQLLEVLIENSKKNKKILMNDPEIRKFSIKSLTTIICKILSLITEDEDAIVEQLVKTYLKTINDHTVDNRGDIGLVVREQTIESIKEFLDEIIKMEKYHLLTPRIMVNLIGWILSQLVEPNDKLRLKAGYILQDIVDNKFEKIPNFEYKEKILEIFKMENLKIHFDDFMEKFFKKYDVSLIEDKKYLMYKDNKNFIYFWNLPKCVYPMLSQLLQFPKLNYNLLKGFVFSIANPITEIKEESQRALIQSIKSEEMKEMILQNLIKMMSSNKRSEKFITSIFQVLNVLLKLKLKDYQNPQLFKTLIEKINAAVVKTKSFKRMKYAVELVFLLSDKIELDCENFDKFKQKIDFFIYSQFPVIRFISIEYMYVFLLIDQENYIPKDKKNQLLKLIPKIDSSDQGLANLRKFDKIWS